MQRPTRRYANPREVQLVRWLVLLGLNNCQISRISGISRTTIRDWRRKPVGWPYVRRIAGSPFAGASCPRCHGQRLDEQAYGYLLGLYLGDGCISEHARSVFKLRIACCDQYPRLIEECRRAMASVKDGLRPPGVVQAAGCVEVTSYWKHWPCLFPQHGPGRKHERTIRLEDWQREIVRRFPEQLIRGLLHSDGCRVLNWVNGTPYPRYMFTNHSADIRGIFSWACDLYGIAWRVMRWQTISVARRPDVARLDLVVGPKY